MTKKRTEFATRSKSGLSSASKGNDSKGDSQFLSVAEIEALLDNLKQPPAVMHWHDFKSAYGLEEDGVNPHRLKKDKDIPKEWMTELFGKPQGDKGRSGYNWIDCKVPEVVARIKFLHPLVYQTIDLEIPQTLSCQFARRLAFEYHQWEKTQK